MSTWDIWNKAIPLAKSYIAWATENHRAIYDELNKESETFSISKVLETIKNDPENFHDALIEMTGTNPQLSDVMDAMKKNVVKWVSTGQLRAYGFSTPRSSNDTPQEIPQDLWHGWIYWDKDKLEGNGLTMVGIRLTSLKSLTQDEERTVSARQGRPSRSDQILTAYISLREEGLIDYKKGLRHHIQMIQERITSLYPENDSSLKGIGEKVLYKDLSKQFSEDKSSH